jgi:hypothetical protein
MRSITAILLLLTTFSLQSQVLNHDRNRKTITIIDTAGNLQLKIDYREGCKVSELKIKGRNTLSSTGAYTSVKTATGVAASSESASEVKVRKRKNSISLSNIEFGNDEMSVSETWIFTVSENGILWDIIRHYKKSGRLDDMAMPAWHFENLSTWKGGILNTGGVVWCKYLENQNDTYGVHTNGVTFWEPVSGNGLRIEANSPTGESLACSFSHSANNEFRFTQYLAPDNPGQRYNLSRFVGKRADVFSSFDIKEGISSVTLHLRYIDYNKEFDRGILAGIDAVAVRELLNTTGRYGVVDKNIIGGNGWITNWKCMHEPFFSQIGMAVNDSNYTKNMASTLDQERDHATENDGRVLARWHDIPEAEKSNYDFKTGYYDCPWGYTIDAQPSQVINTVELFHQTGDIVWLKSHKQNCEKVLNWLIRRDSNNNGIFEMLNDNTGENKCSDWLDVIWASFENSFVNAQMYEALNLWSECETILGDEGKAVYYLRIAARLKEAFNKPVKYGGFWSEEKKQYIYWRDKDGSVHGDNLVTPVNFAAIAFGICDDQVRIKSILDQIERKTTEENLFHWPLCFESFRKEEVYSQVNWPFPNYENGDIFPTWGYLGVRSYVKYNKEIALKYIKKLLQQYNIDGLSSQRFSRTTQKGIGSDILAGSSTTITALYRDIYGIRPKWNRFGLEPGMPGELNGTVFNYTLRNKVYNVHLNENSYKVSTSDFSIEDGNNFGINMEGNTLFYYPGNRNSVELMVSRINTFPIDIAIYEWSDKIRGLKITSTGIYNFSVSNLKPDVTYRLSVNGTETASYKADTAGVVSFEYNCQSPVILNLSE